MRPGPVLFRVGVASAWGIKRETPGGGAACWSGSFSYLAVELVSVGGSLSKGKQFVQFVRDPPRRQQPIATRGKSTNGGFQWDAPFFLLSFFCLCCDKWTVASLTKSFLSRAPLPSFVSRSLSWRLFLSCFLPQLHVMRDHILLTLLQEFWYFSALIDFPSSAIFFKSSPSPTYPRSSSFFLSTKSFSSLMPHKHTNRISISPAERREGKKKKEKKREGKRTGQKSHFQSE